MSITHTYVVLEISTDAFLEIHAKLKAAGYNHAFLEDNGSLAIDMHGIALKRETPVIHQVWDIEGRSHIFRHDKIRHIIPTKIENPYPMSRLGKYMTKISLDDDVIDVYVDYKRLCEDLCIEPNPDFL